MDDEDQPSPSADDLLERFRRQWQQEIASTTGLLPTIREEQSVPESVAPSKPSSSPTADGEDLEEKAASMYLQGVKFEQSGQVVEAIRYYKRAMQLDPDVEKKMYRKPKEENDESDQKNEDHSNKSEDESEVNEDEDQEDNNCTDLLAKFQRIIQRQRRICTFKEQPKATHISTLPCELIIYLLKWVVSADLDLRSLEQVSLVCRGFYVCCRDPELWKLVCIRVWGADSGTPQRNGYPNWRTMFISRPRMHFNGCYISKTSYVRLGENSFQDANYQPWHLVTYYRYLRFFPGGTALMMTTADGPNIIVSQLRGKGSRHSGLLRGFFTLQGNAMSAVFKKHHKVAPLENNQRFRRRRDANNNDGCTAVEQIYELDMVIKPHKKRQHWTLHWTRYVVQTKYLNGEQTKTSYDITPARFPPLFFSRVKSYTAESENPLSLV